MKNISKIIVCLCFIFLGFAFVLTIYAQEINVEGDANAWIYSISRAGLRQEGKEVSQSGELYYKNASLPEAMQHPYLQITNNIGTFEYRPLESLERGWVKVNNIKNVDGLFCEPPVYCEALTPEDLKRGYYPTRITKSGDNMIGGGIGEKRKGTPEDWVFVAVPGDKRPRLDWVDPNHLKEYSEVIINAFSSKVNSVL